MAYENILFERDGAIATLAINRPKALNALNRATLREMWSAIAPLVEDTSLRALILTGAGDKSFVAGADIAEMKALEPAEALAFSGLGHAIGRVLEESPFVTIAAVNGFALGGGCELAMACDLVYASEKARFGQPEVSLGVIPGFGGTSRLVRRVGLQRAKELVFTGDMIIAERAVALGIALQVVPADQLLTHCREVAGKIASRGPLAIAQAKRVMNDGADLPLASANALERQGFAALFGSQDQREGMDAFLDKRPAQFVGR
jgi:enoyl-CoA hydratase